MELTQTRHMLTRDGKRLLVRRLRMGDLRALQHFNDSLSEQSERWFRAHPYDDATVAKVLARSETGEDLTLGVFDGNRLVGYFFLWYFRERTPLLGVGLVDDYQRCGLGRQMLELLIAAGKAAGKQGIELTTMQDNDRAFSLYQKAGFRYHKDVENLQGDGSIVIERAMFYGIEPGALPLAAEHRPPV